MESQNQIRQENTRKPIFIAKYLAGDDTKTGEYLFIYMCRGCETEKEYHKCQRDYDPEAARIKLNKRFPEGLKFALASKVLLSKFICDKRLEQLSIEEFKKLLPQLERRTEGVIPFPLNKIIYENHEMEAFKKAK